MVTPVVMEMWLPAPASLLTMVTFWVPVISILTVMACVALTAGPRSGLVDLRFFGGPNARVRGDGRKGAGGRRGGSGSSGRGVVDEPWGSEAAEGFTRAVGLGSSGP